LIKIICFKEQAKKIPFELNLITKCIKKSPTISMSRNKSIHMPTYLDIQLRTLHSKSILAGDLLIFYYAIIILKNLNRPLHN
jgi:hypothetical protein